MKFPDKNKAMQKESISDSVIGYSKGSKKKKKKKESMQQMFAKHLMHSSKKKS
jgi:hypothetical protein